MKSVAKTVSCYCGRCTWDAANRTLGTGAMVLEHGWFTEYGPTQERYCSQCGAELHRNGALAGWAGPPQEAYEYALEFAHMDVVMRLPNDPVQRAEKFATLRRRALEYGLLFAAENAEEGKLPCTSAPSS